MAPLIFSKIVSTGGTLSNFKMAPRYGPEARLDKMPPLGPTDADLVFEILHPRFTRAAVYLMTERANKCHEKPTTGFPIKPDLAPQSVHSRGGEDRGPRRSRREREEEKGRKRREEGRREGGGKRGPGPQAPASVF